MPASFQKVILSTLAFMLSTLAPVAAANRVEVSDTTIWFCPDAPFKRLEKEHQTDYDYYGLFEANAGWQRASKKVRIFKVGEQFIFRTPDEQLRKMLADLDRRGIALAMEAGLLSGHDDCGKGVEGYSAPLGAKVSAQKIARLGGNLQYVAMDEPLWYGNHFSGKNCCHSTVEQLALNIKSQLADLRSVFPNIKVGDIEPVAAAGMPDWNDQIIRWTEVYERIVGEPLAFFHADIDWSGPWSQKIVDLRNQLNAHHIPLGIIYDGSGVEDQQWTGSALANAVFIEDVLKVKPSDAIVQTWMPHPKYLLPETKPGTMTNLLDLYAAQPTVLKLDNRGDTFAGTVTDASGRPLPNVPVLLRTTSDASSSRIGRQQRTGVVPAGAVKGVFALRIMENTTPSALSIGSGNMGFTDTQTGRAVPGQFNLPRNQRAGNGQILLLPGQKCNPNGQSFAVSPGHSYNFFADMAVPATFQGKGFFAIVFLAAGGEQLSYDSIDLKYQVGENSRVVSRTTTSADGSFSFADTANKPVDANQARYVQFIGGPAHRMTRTADLHQ